MWPVGPLWTVTAAQRFLRPEPRKRLPGLHPMARDKSRFSAPCIVLGLQCGVHVSELALVSDYLVCTSVSNADCLGLMSTCQRPWPLAQFWPWSGSAGMWQGVSPGQWSRHLLQM